MCQQFWQDTQWIFLASRTVELGGVWGRSRGHSPEARCVTVTLIEIWYGKDNWAKGVMTGCWESRVCVNQKKNTVPHKFNKRSKRRTNCMKHRCCILATFFLGGGWTVLIVSPGMHLSYLLSYRKIETNQSDYTHTGKALTPDLSVLCFIISVDENILTYFEQKKIT